MLFLIGLIGVLTLLIFFKYARRPKNLPPGPTGWPIVGYLPFLGKIPYVTLSDLSKTYGNVVGITLGFRFVVVLNDYSTIREAAGKEAFLGRPPDSVFELITHHFPKYITGISGPLWREHRRFAVHAFKDTGLGKTEMEDYIKDEIEHAMSEIPTENVRIKVSGIYSSIASNVICILCFGKRFSYSDPQWSKMQHCIHTILASTGGASGCSFYPFVLNWIIRYKKFGFQKFFNATRDFREFVSQQVDHHTKTFNEGIMRDYIDRYLLQQKEKLEKDQNTTYTKEMLIGNVAEFFSAGTDTSSSTLEWLTLFMALHTDIQKKVHDEIDDVIGQDGQPSWNDHPRMVYTRAVILETQRWASIAPLGVFRGALEDTTLKGYHIPKDTMVLFNLWAMHHDPKYWKEPEKFDPERFIEDGKLNTKLESYGPFSLGRRSCPGEVLAHLELFLIFTCFMQKFRFELPDDMNLKDIDLTPKNPLGITMQPKFDAFYLIKRDKN